MERRFDSLERELSKNSRIDKVEKDMSSIRDSCYSLAVDLKTFMKSLGGGQYQDVVERG